jgi:L-amino acid N-acyltransferase YncA
MSRWSVENELTPGDAATIYDLAIDHGDARRSDVTESELEQIVDGGYQVWKNSPVFVARNHRGDIIGFAYARRHRQRHREAVYISDSTLSLRAVVVATDSRRQGVGSGLLRAMKEFTAQRGFQHIVARISREQRTLFEIAGWDITNASWAWIETKSYATAVNDNTGDADIRMVRWESRDHHLLARAVGRSDRGVAIEAATGATDEDVFEALANRARPDWDTYKSIRELAASGGANLR